MLPRVPPGVRSSIDDESNSGLSNGFAQIPCPEAL